jgi:hypothetical protein
VADPVGSGEDLEAVNEAVRGRRTQVDVRPSRLAGRGRVVVAEGVRVGAETTGLTLLLEPVKANALWGTHTYGARRDTTLSTSAISRITFTSRVRGAIDGIFVGSAIGAAFGAIVAGNDPWIPRDVGGFVFGVIGCSLGATTGLMRGSRETFEFVER